MLIEFQLYIWMKLNIISSDIKLNKYKAIKQNKWIKD